MRRKRRTRATRHKQSEFGIIGFFLAAVILAILAYLLKDALRVPLGLLGSGVWLLGLMSAFFLGLLYHAQYLLPLGGHEGWMEGLRLVWRHYLIQGDRYLANLLGTLPLHPLSRPSGGPDDLPASFTTLKAGIIPNYQALALARGRSFTRAAGPGYVPLFPNETVRGVIDLRTQVRSQPVQAHTRDGIPVESRVSVVFHVRRPSLEPDDSRVPYLYDRDAIFHVCHSFSVDEEDHEQPWTEQLTPQAATLLIDEIARYRLDDYYATSEGHSNPLGEIKNSVKQQLQRMVEADGIDIISVGVSGLEVPETVMEQRVATWQSEWQRKIQTQATAGEAEAVRREKEARAKAQIEIITTITRNIDVMRQTGNTQLTDIVMLRMIEAMEESLTDPIVRSLIPEQFLSSMVNRTSQQIRYLTETDNPQ